MDRFEVVVVGAGAIGCSIAAALAPDHDLLVVDRTGVAAEATGRSAGLVSPTLFYGAYPGAARHANDAFRDLDGTGAFSFTEWPRLDYVTPEDEAEARGAAERRSEAGFPVSYLPREAVERRYPVANLDSFAGAVRYGDTGWVDPATYARTLLDVAIANGADVEFDTTVEALSVSGDVVDGVETDGGSYGADRVVLAAGYRTSALLPGARVPIRPYRTQCATLASGTEIEGTLPIGRVASEGLYFRPEHGGELLVGGRHDPVEVPEHASERADESFLRTVAAEVPRLLRGFEGARVVGSWAGVDAGTPDGRPVIGRPTGAPGGALVATGFNGLGITLSPVAAALVRSLVAGEECPFETEPFRADRFETDRPEFSLRSTADL